MNLISREDYRQFGGMMHEHFLLSQVEGMDRTVVQQKLNRVTDFDGHVDETRYTEIKQKLLCVNGPYTGEYRTEDECQGYLVFNRAARTMPSSEESKENSVLILI
jgi:hypothetical protein